MPAAFVLHLNAQRPPALIKLRGWLYHALTPAFPELHDRPGPKPFALAAWGDASGVWARFAFLEDSLAKAAAGLLWERLNQPVPLPPENPRVLAVYEHAHPWSGRRDWGELMAAAPSADLPLEFQSPTFFRRRDANYPIPSPGLILASLIRDWNAFAPEPVPPEVAERLVEYTTARHLNVRTVSVTAHSRTPGFVGRVTLHLPRATEEEARWLARLGELAFFSGVGAKTTLGFGLVRRYELDGQGAKGAHPDGGAGGRSADRKP